MNQDTHESGLNSDLHRCVPGTCPEFSSCSDSYVRQSCSRSGARHHCAPRPLYSPCSLSSHILHWFGNRLYSHSSSALLLGGTGCWGLCTEPLLPRSMLQASSQSTWMTGGW